MAVADERIRVVYYTRPAFLDHSLPLVRAVAEQAAVHLLLELSPEERAAGMFGEEQIGARAGVHPACGALRRGYLAEARSFLNGLEGFDFVVHTSQRAYAPLAWAVAGAASLHIRRLAPHVLHFEDLTPRSSPLLFTLPGIPKLVAIHDAHTHLGERIGRAERIRRVAARRADRLLFYSRFSQAQYLASGPAAQTAVIPLGPKLVWSELPGASAVEREPTLLFFGRLSAYKGLDVLYAALPAIAGKVPNLRIVVAGGPGPDFAIPPAPTLPHDTELVTHFERIDPPTLRRLFEEASLVVLPYVEASQSGVVQTAYAFHTPVVASAVGGLPEAVIDGITGRLVPPNDPSSLATAVTDLLLNRSLRAQMREGIRQLEHTDFGWPMAARKLTHLYGVLSARA